MIAIILSTCLITDPDVCRDQKLPLPAEVSAIQCMKFAMPRVTQWSEEHPQWRIVRWRCRSASHEDT